MYADYKALVGAEPGEIHCIGIARSSSFIKSRVIADYDDFQLLNMEAWWTDNSPAVVTLEPPATTHRQ